MSSTKDTKLSPFTKASLAVILASAVTGAVAEPSQLPLLTRDGWEGKPNVVFTLDDSGSMAWQFMPDDMWNNWSGGAYSTGWDPSEVNAWPRSRTTYIATIANDLLVARYRSSGINRVYYNPEIRYVPWSFEDGASMPDSPPTAAFVEPMDLSRGTVDLTTVSTVTARWCVTGNCNNQGLEYAPATYFEYSGTTDADENVLGNYNRVRIADSTSFERGAGRIDCSVSVINPAGHTCSQAQEFQNFANWFSYYRSRMRTAIGATSRAFSQQGDGLRVGYGRINKGFSTVDNVSHGTMVAGVRTFSGSARASFFTWLYQQFGSGGTPLRRAMDDVGVYFERPDDDGPWGSDPGNGNNDPHLECRKSYHILMSDGYWNSASARVSAARANVDGNPSTGGPITGPGGQSYTYSPVDPFQDTQSNTLADVAMYYWYRDLRPDLANRVRPDVDNPAFWQQIVQFTVGMGVFGDLDPSTDLLALTAGTKSWTNANTNPGKIDDMWHAAVNSRGQYLSASNPDQFADALSAILQSISERESAEGGSAVSAVILDTGALKFIPTYQTATWAGDVQAKILDQNGVAIGDAWRASDQLPEPDARNIKIADSNGKTLHDFKWATMPTNLKTLMGPTASEDRVNWIRGDRSNEGTAFRARDADSVLGDMVNSTPLLIDALNDDQYDYLPASIPGGGSYRAFMRSKKYRDPVLFIGANDGMVHGFRKDTGVEQFAYIPHSVIDKLVLPSEPSYDHRFLVDGPMMQGDAYIGGSWKTVLIGSTGAGGQSMFALDVTDPTNPQLMWELRNGLAGIGQLGYVLAPASIGVMPNGQWVAAIGNGYESPGGMANLYLIDLADGSLVKKISTNEGGNNGLGGISLIKDGGNVIVGAYAGDQKGKIWRFDLSSTSPGDWGLGFGGNPLFQATRPNGSVQPIQAAPEYVNHPQGGQLVVFGTGRLYEENDLAVLGDETLYGVWDKIPGHQETNAASQAFQAGDQLVTQTFTNGFTGASTDFNQSTTTHVDYSTHRGWKLDLTLEAGQRLIYQPQLVRGMAMFNTVAPTGGTGLPCDDSRSTGYTIFVNPISGAAPKKPLFDTNGDGTIDSNDQIATAFKTVAEGRTTVVFKRSPNSGASLQTATTNTDAALGGRGITRFWRQLLNPPTAF